MASTQKVVNQAAMVSLGRPAAEEDLPTRYGFSDIRRVMIPYAWEFADPALYPRTIASNGPAFEAMEDVGAAEFLEFALDHAGAHVRDGLPLRATIDVVGYLATKPSA